VVFSSVEFLWLFMPVVLALYLVVPPAGRNALLALVSLVFYAWGAGALVFVMLGSIAFNYVFGRTIGAAVDAKQVERARWLTTAAVTGNVALLFFWKYAVFASTQLDDAIGLFGGDGFGIPSILLPIGISFFTFHAISYVVDIHRGTARAMRKPWEFGQYMTFFPQLIAGPIVRYHQIDDQIRNPPARSERMDDIAEGFPRFAWGLAKKVLIADQIAPIADAAFANGTDPTTASAWIGIFAYAIQLYFDFSGYTDMAIGLARMFGFKFPENFNRPYSAVSLTDFWRRWHMTLARWFQDYVYFPIGGSRGNQSQTARNLIFVFVLVGLWHGASWTYAIWGLLTGLVLVFERLVGINKLADDLYVVFRRIATFLTFVLLLVMFRSADLSQAADMYRAMFSFDTSSLPSAVDADLTGRALCAFAIGFATVALPRDFVVGLKLQDRWSGTPLALRIAVLVVLPFAAIGVAAGSFSPFIYFQF
jgi:alginate O-acetyltransferase complex protein AlgI